MGQALDQRHVSEIVEAAASRSSRAHDQQGTSADRGLEGNRCIAPAPQCEPWRTGRRPDRISGSDMRGMCEAIPFQTGHELGGIGHCLPDHGPKDAEGRLDEPLTERPWPGWAFGAASDDVGDLQSDSGDR